MSSIPLRWGGMHFDCGGILFDLSDFNYNLDINSYSTFAVVQLDQINIVGSFPYNRQVFVWPDSDSLSIFEQNGEIGTTVNDITSWKGVRYTINFDYKTTFIAYSMVNGNIEAVKVFDIYGNKIGESSRSDIAPAGKQYINFPTIGARTDNKQKLHGTVYAAAVFSKVIPDDEFSDLIKNWNCEDCYRDIDGCVFACIFDRIKYGDTPYDFINDVYGQPVDPDHPPRWRLKLIKDLE